MTAELGDEEAEKSEGGAAMKYKGLEAKGWKWRTSKERQDHNGYFEFNKQFPVVVQQPQRKLDKEQYSSSMQDNIQYKLYLRAGV
ncbi:hypothetical protein Pmani_014490 [Petrolisthes manimaculis]|uniref:Uncharacterized protein n=1 Tax=Petrolisthes manimaculis TaxID=1843537 RepID=A0AAE1U8B9_9EUCA|nr:hypothetical protein Pmani_014490 [Petrolisthes manimaculis]